MSKPSITQVPPYHYIHVLDQNTKVTRLETGPLNYIHQNNQRMLFSPKRMITVAPLHYCVVTNPVTRDDNGQVVFSQSGEAILRQGGLQLRLTQDPFPLYPGEELHEDVTLLPTVPEGLVLHLQALQDFQDEGGQKRAARDEWLFKGPGIYIPRKEVKVLEIIQDPDTGTQKEDGRNSGTFLKGAGTVLAVAAGAVGAVAAAPVVLTAVGFTSAGIASGSIAAGMMSSAAIANGGGVAAGSMVALLQSAGAAGLGATGTAVVGGVGGAVGGAVGGLASWLTGKPAAPASSQPTEPSMERLMYLYSIPLQ